MKVSIELTEPEIRTIIAAHLNAQYGFNVSGDQLPIQVKSKQNYKSEWEEAAIRINVEVTKQ